MDKAKRIIKRIFKVIGYTIGAVFAIATITAISLAIYTITLVRPVVQESWKISDDSMSMITDETFGNLEDTVIYGSQGEMIGKLYAGDYQYVGIEDTSKWLIDGYVSVEDRTFWEHEGVDYMAIMRAMLVMYKNNWVPTQGGSTITQQVVKNNILTPEKTLNRKLVEFFTAVEIEKVYSKNDIMEFYLNTNSYGNNCIGIGSASRYYFKKPAKDLDIHEAALLIGISNNPTKYNPKSKPEVAKEKRNSMLSIMYDQGVINERQYNEARSKGIELELFREPTNQQTYRASFALHSAILKLMEDEFEFEYTFSDKDRYEDYKERYSEKYSEVSDRIRKGGYTIYTSLDAEKQEIVQQVLDKHLNKYTEVSSDGRYALQGASVLIDNDTGYVEAIVGGRGTEDTFNRGFLGVRQPGSAIKPLIVYGPAYDTPEYYPSKKVEDSFIEDGPKNAGGNYRGNVSMREATARSINTIAYKVLEDIGPNKGLEYLGKMRFGNLTYIDNNNKSLALGGFTYGVTPLDMAKGFSTLVNNGMYTDATCITKIEFQGKGTIVGKDMKYTQVYTKESAYMVLESLESTIEKPYGTARRMKINNVVAGGKTGTTNQQKDAWFIGVTPKHTLSVWAGYDSPRPTNMYGSSEPGQIWKEVMEKISDEGAREFNRPDTVVERDINWRGDRVDHSTGNKDIFSLPFIESEERDKQVALEREIRAEIDRINGSIDAGNVNIEYEYGKIQDIKKKINKITNENLKSDLENKIHGIGVRLETQINAYKKEIERQRQIQQEELETDIETRIASVDIELMYSFGEITVELEDKVKEIEAQIDKLDSNRRDKFKGDMGRIRKVIDDAQKIDIELEEVEEEIEEEVEEG